MLTVFQNVFFFFSSRRRHTRLQGDWSSERVLFRSFLRRTRVELLELDEQARQLLGLDTVASVVDLDAKEVRSFRHGADRHHAAGGSELERVGKRSEEHTSELQSPCNLVCRLLLEKKK